MTRISCAVFTLFSFLAFAMPAFAAGTVASVGFQCTNDPQYK
jgi:hypothetical protein